MAKKIPTGLYFKLLKYIYSKGGLISKVNITLILSQYFENETLADVWWDLKSEEYQKTLKPMIDAGHIVFELDTTKPKTNFPNGEGLAYAYLTPVGYAFYKEHINSYWTRIISIIALIISAIALFFTVWQAVSTHNAKPLESKTQSLKSKTESS